MAVAMAATASLCGSKRCFFEEDDFVPSSLSPPLLKKIRRSPSSSSSLCRCKEPSETTLTLCGTKRSFIEDDFVSSSSASLPKRIRLSLDASMKKKSATRDEDSSWVDLFVGEMLKATSVDDAKSRASTLLTGILEEVVKGLSVENKKLKEQGEALVKENGTLKHAVVALHQKHRECQDENRELMQLNQLAKEKVRELELKNYELGLHLNQALQGTSFTHRLPPHVF